jgi:hypothetical protein
MYAWFQYAKHEIWLWYGFLLPCKKQVVRYIRLVS